MTEPKEMTHPLAKKQIIPVIPDTPAGQQFAKWLDAFNTGDVNLLSDFHAQHDDESVLQKFAAGDRALMDNLLYRNTHGFDLYRIDQFSNYETVALVQSRLTQGWAYLKLRTASELPYGITSIIYQPIVRPADIAVLTWMKFSYFGKY